MILSNSRSIEYLGFVHFCQSFGTDLHPELLKTVAEMSNLQPRNAENIPCTCSSELIETGYSWV